jgi:ABC-type nitrate/sulfonate/bicarbonate transport system permease component
MSLLLIGFAVGYVIGVPLSYLLARRWLLKKYAEIAGL